MYKLQFTLKQHTPIIHFQYDQDGATLRATEVKPKLDRFIIEKMGGKNKVPDKWFYDKEKGSLNYKIRIETEGCKVIKVADYHRNTPMYFGNMGNSTPKHMVISNGLNCKVISLNRDLIEKLKEVLSKFFFTHNFGSRQSKGYGSFEIIEINGQKVENDYSSHNLKFSIQTNSWEDALYQVNLFYRSLRSGINEIEGRPTYKDPENPNKAFMQQNTKSKFYFKPLIFLYAKSLGKQWDKKRIKQTYFTDYSYRFLSPKEKNELKWDKDFPNKMEELGLKQQTVKHLNSDVLTFSETLNNNDLFWDFKDVFGLSSNERWKSYGKTIVKVNATKNSNKDTFAKKDIKAKNFVERFASPIWFKPLKSGDNEFTIYIHYRELPTEYLGEKFIVYDNNEEANPKLCLQIPSSFSFKDFFDFIKNDFNIDSHIDAKYKNATDFRHKKLNYFETLKRIYNQIQS